MATTVDELQVLITADVARLKQGLNVVQKQLASLKGSTGTAGKSMSASMVAAGTIIGNIATRVISAGFSAISSSVDGAISRLDTLNNYERVMSNLGIGASDAQKSIQVLQEALLGLPTTLDDASLSVQRLVSANGNIAASTDMFLAFNNALLAGGAGADIQRAALEQMMQAYAKGKPEAEEWRSLMTAMPAQLKQIATALGYTSTAIGGDLYNDIQTGKLSMDDFMLTIVKLNKEGVGSFESFETQARNSTGGVATSITNLKTAITRGITDVMNVIGQSNIAGFFNNIASVIGNVATYVAAFVKIIKEAVAWIGALFGGSGSTENLVKETGGAADNMESVSSGAASAAGSLNDAGSAAKKLKNQLAGFDEMNVLTESSSGSGGGSGGGGSAGSNLGDYNWDSSGLTDGADKIDKAVEDIKKKFQALSKFLSSVFPKSIKKIEQLFGNLGKIGSDTAKFIKKTWSTMGTEISVAFGNAISGLVGLLDSVSAALLSPFTGFFQGFSDQWEQIGQAAIDALGVLAIVFGNTIGELARQMQVPFDTLSTYLQTAGSNLGGLVAQIFTDFLTSFAEQAPLIQESFLTFTSGISGTLTLFAELAGTIWEGFTQTLKDVWDKYGKSITDGIATAVGNIIGTFQRIYDEILEPIINPFLTMLKETWDNHIQGMVDKVAEFIAKLIDGALQIYNNFISPIVNFLVDILGPVFVAVGTTIGGAFNTVLGVISDVVGSIFGVLGGLIDFITGIFTGNWEKAWNGVKDIFSNIVNGLVGIIKAPINFIIDAINGFINGLNQIKIPDWVPVVGGFSLDIPNIPKLATGGIITAPTAAIIGEAGREAVLPLDRNTSWMDELADKIASKSIGQGQQITVMIGDEVVYDRVVEFINNQSALQNRSVIRL